MPQSHNARRTSYQGHCRRREAGTVLDDLRDGRRPARRTRFADAAAPHGLPLRPPARSMGGASRSSTSHEDALAPESQGPPVRSG